MLGLLGISRSSWHYRSSPRPRATDPVHQRDRAYPSRLSDEEVGAIVTKLREGFARGRSVYAAWYDALDAGDPIASIRTWYRVCDSHLAGERPERARSMFETAIHDQNGAVPRVIHADSGAAMKSHALQDFCREHGIEKTHNRPRVSNDNPYIESWFKTLKYQYSYPKYFDSLQHAHDWVARVITDYNTNHKHSNMEGHTPSS